MLVKRTKKNEMEVFIMSLLNVAEFAGNAASCGAGEKPSACGSACGAGDKPSACGSACGACDK